MAKRNRATLRKFFGKGMLPSENHFHDLIDSTVNIVDQGFNKTEETGLEISSLGSHERLISLSRNDQPVWSIGYDGTKDTLLFKKLTDEGEILAGLVGGLGGAFLGDERALVEELKRLPGILFEVGKLLGSDQETGALLSRLSELCCQLLACDSCSVMLLDAGHNTSDSHPLFWPSIREFLEK